MSFELSPLADRSQAESQAAQIQNIRDRARAAHQQQGGSEGGLPQIRMPDCEGNEKAFVACGGCCCVSFLFLMLCSLGSVPPLYHGVRYNMWNKAVSTGPDGVFECGRYFIGPWNTLVLFPANVQTIEFTNDKKLSKSGARFPQLQTRTREGLALQLHFSLQYILPKATLSNVYKQFLTKYEDVFVSTIRDRLNKVAMEYEATAFWEQRREVGIRMQTEAKTALQEMFADSWDLELMVIDLPDKYENSIVLTQVQKQMKYTKEYEQQTAQIRAETSVIAAEYDRQCKVITAKGKANYTFTTKNATAVARQNTILVESSALSGVGANLSLDSVSLSTYQTYAFYGGMDKANVFFGFDAGSSMNIMMEADDCPSDADGTDSLGNVEKSLNTQAKPFARILGDLPKRKFVKIDDWNCQCKRKNEL